MIDEARKRRRKFGVLHIDVEAEYQMTSDFIKRMIENNKDVIIPYWVCLPMESPNSLILRSNLGMVDKGKRRYMGKRNAKNGLYN